MSIILKVARSAREIDDVFKLRYDIYVREKKRFKSIDTELNTSERMVDRFDSIPGSTNIIAYEDDIAIACLRVNIDSDIGLPSESYFDFTPVRSKLAQEFQGKSTVVVSGGMLAIREKYRNRRNVIYALFKIAIGIMHSFNATHVFSTVSESTKSLYGRIGFKEVGEPVWSDSIQDKLMPMVASFDDVFNWAFGDVTGKINPFWLNNFCGRFERLLLSAGEILFKQDAPGGHAYAIDNGWISISRRDKDGNEMVLSNLSQGDLFGELAIFDSGARSATATAITNVELIVIKREKLIELLKQNPDQLTEFMQYFSKRLREMDELTMVRAFLSEKERVDYALNRLWSSAIPDRNMPNIKVAKVGPEQIAKSAHVKKDDVIAVLEKEKALGNIEYSNKVIKFINHLSCNNTDIMKFRDTH